MDAQSLWKLLQDSLDKYDSVSNEYSYWLLVADRILSTGMEFPRWVWPIKNEQMRRNVDVREVDRVLTKYGRPLKRIVTATPDNPLCEGIIHCVLP